MNGLHKDVEYYSYFFVASFIGLRIYAPIYLLSIFVLGSCCCIFALNAVPCTVILHYVAPEGPERKDILFLCTQKQLHRGMTIKLTWLDVFPGYN